MDMKGKTKDNIKATMDLVLYCDHRNMEFLVIGYGSQRLKPSLF
jgi:tRNA A37 threonylcarbamoyladenosine dehydratase